MGIPGNSFPLMNPPPQVNPSSLKGVGTLWSLLQVAPIPPGASASKFDFLRLSNIMSGVRTGDEVHWKRVREKVGQKVVGQEAANSG